MSLFSLLKYPVYDILNEEQLNAVPKDVLDTWLDLISTYGDIDRSLYFFIFGPKNKINHYIIKGAIKNYVASHNKKCEPMNVMTHEDVKANFTKLLHILLNEYEEKTQFPGVVQ